MAAGKLADDQWITYGHALDVCGPKTKPWESFDTNQVLYWRQYVVPFVNGDVRRGIFQRREPKMYDHILHEWGING